MKLLPDTAPRMYVDDAVQHAQAAKGGGAAAGVAALSLEPSPAPATLWVLVELERPVFCPENSICVASKLEVRAKTSFAQNLGHKPFIIPSQICRWSMLLAAESRFMDALLALFTTPRSACS